jgi:hypothetical protein
MPSCKVSFLAAGILKRIDAPRAAPQREGAEENHIGIAEVFICFPRGEEVKIDGRLIKTAATADFPCAVVAHLHLKDEPRAGGIGNEYVETNALALVRALERIFVFDVGNIFPRCRVFAR